MNINKESTKVSKSNSCWKRRNKYNEKNNQKLDETEKLNDISDNIYSKNQETIHSIDEINKKNNKHSCLSMKSLQSEQTDLLLQSKFIHNSIRIQDSNGFFLNNQGIKYLNFKFEHDENGSLIRVSEQLRYIPKFMSTVWKLKNPKIIIPIITGVTNFKNWKNRKLEDQFKHGIIKAANKTEIWFITNGMNGGITQMVGDAISEELSNRSSNSIKKNKKTNNLIQSDSELELKPLVLIGIVDSSSLNNFSAFDGNDNGFIRAIGTKLSGKNFKFDLNADHTNVIVYDEKNNSEQMNYNSFRNRLESLFTKSLSHYKRVLSSTSGDVSDDDTELSKPKAENRQIPMVCLTIRGDLSSIDAIEFKVKKEIPVVILKGSGGASDIIAFAIEEMTENKDPDYEESYMRPELSKKLLEEFNEELSKNDVLRNKYRDKILSIVKNGTKGKQMFVTLVDMKGLTFDFQDLDKYILTALLKSQTQLSGKSGQTQLDRNLRLTLDWNREDLALSEIFQRDDYKQIDIKHGIFENAILRRDREQFVELFLDQGFYIHRYLGRNNIRDLFEKTENRDFFVTVILQGMLGHFTTELPDNFLPDGLNHVLKKLTSIDHMVNILEIYMNQLGFYVTDAKHAEKKALNFLIIFAILMNRHKLAKMLWKRTEDPIPVALVCSLMYKNLLPYCQENYIRSQIEKYQVDFADCAVGVLNTSFQENDPRSYAVLQEKYIDWNNSTALELAYNSKNRNFIAHPCCQKMLTKRLFGHIQVREFNKSFFLVDLPIWIKVIISAFFILPMYYWIIFPVVEKKINIENENNDEDDEEDKDEEKEEEAVTRAELNRKLLKEINKTKSRSYSIALQKNTIGRLVNSSIENDPLIEKKLNSEATTTALPKVAFEERTNKKSRKFDTPPIHKKIYMLWTAPYTKFWINFLSYICFLMLFGVVTLWPACGNLLLDSILWFWTATLAVEDTRVAYYKYFTGSQLPLRGQIIEIIVMIVFLIVFLIVRIVGIWNIEIEYGSIDRIFLSKIVLCVFLLYFYYRTVFIFLPISHKLGPMLVRMKLMIKHDFTTYLRLFLIFMTAGAIALNAILYPNYPVNLELFKRVILYRGFMQLFASDKVDLERASDECKYSNKGNISYTCVNLTNGLDFRYTSDKLRDYGIAYKCNHQSTWAWVILIQYFLLVKLFLPSLLTAMFSATGQRISAQSEQLWMFQRYEIVLDYENRLTFPPPFTFISYIIMFFEWLWHQYTCCWRKCKSYCSKCCNNKNSDQQTQQQQQLQQTQDFNKQLQKPSTNVLHYWRTLAQSYAKESEKEEKEKQKQKYLETSLNNVREDLASQKKSLQRLNDRVISLEKSFIQNQSYLEQIKNLLTQKTSKSTLFDRKKSNYIHILSRESPYIFTNISRFFVYEKLVPWECAYDVYDPPFISLSNELLKVDKIFIDDEPNPKLFEDSTSSVKNQFELGPCEHGPLLSSTQNLTDVNSDNNTRNTTTSAAAPTTTTTTTYNKSITGSQLSLSQAKQKTFLWNAIMNIDLPDGRVITVDRKSWIIKIDEQLSNTCPLIYSLDSLGLPRNPMGRTGIRGRGALYRYGPNHEIMAIVTRWKKYKNKTIYVDRRKLLEFIACKDSLTSQMKIPGDKVVGDESKFSVVCRTFMELVFEETSVERVTSFSEQDMTTFFASFASNKSIVWDTSISNQQLISMFNDLGFFATLIYSGYIDDPRNTDNAWIEAEIWNFHYDKDEYFDKRIKNPTSKWREVSSNVRIHSNDIIVDVLKEVAETHNAFYN